MMMRQPMESLSPHHNYQQHPPPLDQAANRNTAHPQAFRKPKNGPSREVVSAALRAGTDRNTGNRTVQDWTGQEVSDGSATSWSPDDQKWL